MVQNPPQKYFFLQGRYGKGKGQEFVQQFLIEYRRPRSVKGGRGERDWIVYSDKEGTQVKN